MTKLSHIMLVEDEPDIREIALIALKDIGGFDVTLCSSGKEAVTRFKAESPQLVILDVMMPGMDGPTTFNDLKLHHPDIQAIFMTARVQPQEVKEYLNMGAIGVIHKPFDPVLLSRDILKLWNDRL